MANKKQFEKKEETEKKKVQPKNSSTTTKKTNSKQNSKKQTTSKPTTTKSTKKTNSTNTKTKNTSKTITNKIVKKVKEEEVKVKAVELAKVLNEENKDITFETQKKETLLKVEEAKFPKKKDKKLLVIGIFIVILGLMSLFISLVANRIVDREFLSDNAITFMIISSIIIEGFGAFIIINES